MAERISRINLSISLVSIVIAGSALWLSYYQGSLQKENYEISIQPYLTVVPTINPEKKEYGYYIYNSGAGRGYIDKVEYYFDGILISGMNIEPLKKVAIKLGLDPNCLAYGNPRINDAISLDEMNKLLVLSSIAGIECKQTIDNLQQSIILFQSRFTTKIWYRSLYNIKFMYDSASNIQTKI